MGTARAVRRGRRAHEHGPPPPRTVPRPSRSPVPFPSASGPPHPPTPPPAPPLPATRATAAYSRRRRRRRRARRRRRRVTLGGGARPLANGMHRRCRSDSPLHHPSPPHTPRRTAASGRRPRRRSASFIRLAPPPARLPPSPPSSQPRHLSIHPPAPRTAHAHGPALLGGGDGYGREGGKEGEGWQRGGVMPRGGSTTAAAPCVGSPCTGEGRAQTVGRRGRNQHHAQPASHRPRPVPTAAAEGISKADAPNCVSGGTHRGCVQRRCSLW